MVDQVLLTPIQGFLNIKKVFKKVVKAALPVAAAIGIGMATGGFGTAASAAWGSAGGLGSIGAAGVGGGLFSGMTLGTALQGAGLLSNVAGSIQSKKYASQQNQFQSQQVAQQNKAEEARNRYNQLLQKRSRLATIRQARIGQGQIGGSMGALGAGGTSGYTGAVGAIGTQTSANLGNINVAQDVGNQITGFNVAAANAGSQANTAASKSNMWSDASTLGGTLLSQGGNIASIFGQS